MSSVVVKKNKWENQYIKKKFRRKGLDSSGRYYVKATKHSNSPDLCGCSKRNKRVLNIIDSKAICNNITKNYYDINDYNHNITNFSVKYNIIQIWVCNKCTYRNIERLDHCTMCNNPYSLNKTTKINNNKSNQLNGQNITLNDFISIKIKNEYNLNYDKTHKISNDYFWDNSHGNRDDGGIIFLKQCIKTSKKRKRSQCKKNKMRNYYNFRDYWISMQQDLKKTNAFKPRKKQQHKSRHNEDRKKLLEACLDSIKYLKKDAVCMQVEYLIKDDKWLKKLNINKKNLIYTASIQHWEQMAKSAGCVDNKYNEQEINKMLQYDSILSKTDNELLVCGYLRRNQYYYIPSVIILLCTSLCGVISSLLPYRFSNGFDFGQYYTFKNKKISNCYDHIDIFYERDANKIFKNDTTKPGDDYYSNTESSLYICVPLSSSNKSSYRLNEIIPLFKISKFIGFRTLKFKGFEFKGLKSKKLKEMEFDIESKRSNDYICSLTKLLINIPVQGCPWIPVCDYNWYEKKAIEKYVRTYGKSPATGRKMKSNWIGSYYNNSWSERKHKEAIDVYKAFIKESEIKMFQLFCKLFSS